MRLVFAALLQPRVLQHAFQNQFTPVALGFLAFECPGKVGGFIAQSQVQLLKALQLLAQREAFARFLLITLLNALFKRLNALFEGVKQLPQALVTGLGKALLALIENLAGQLRELRAQLITRTLQITETLLMAFLLLTQLGRLRSHLGIKPAQFDFLLRPLKVPGMGGIPCVVTLNLQQLNFTAQCGQLGLFGGIGLAQITDLVSTGIQLRVEALLGQLRHAQPLIQQRAFSV